MEDVGGLATLDPPVEEIEGQEAIEDGHTAAPGPEAAMRMEQDKVDREQLERRRKQLQLDVGGAPVDLSKIQITGGSIEIPPEQTPEKGAELRLTITGYVKTVKFDDRRENGDIVGATREAVFVVDSIEWED